MVHGQCYHLVVHGRRTAEYITCNNFLDPCHAVIITVLWSVSYLMTGADGLFVPRTIPFVFRTSYTCIMEIASHSHFSYYYKSGVIHSGYSGASDTRQPPSHSSLFTPYSILAYTLVILCASSKLDMSSLHEHFQVDTRNRSPYNISIGDNIFMRTSKVFTRPSDHINHQVHCLFTCRCAGQVIRWLTVASTRPPLRASWVDW
jgi:hypothetical protein